MTAEDEILSARLMLQRHQGYDVAIRRKIWFRIDEGTQIPRVRAAFQIQYRAQATSRQIAVAHMTLRAVSSAYVPSTPALIQRTAMIGKKRSSRLNGEAFGVGEDGADK